MGLIIGEELDHHLELLEDTDARMDYTENRLGQADRRLREITRKAKANSN